MSRAELVAQVARRAADLAASHGGAPDARAVEVPGDRPLDAVVLLLAAVDQGLVPVVTGPEPDPAGRARLVAAAERLRGGQLVVATSGSRGAPRAVVRSVASWQSSLAPFSALAGLPGQPGAGSAEVVWAPGGLSSTLTLFAVWHALSSAVPLVAGGRWRGEVPPGVTLVHCVPTVLSDLLCDLPSSPPGRSLRRAVVAGAGGSRALRHRAAVHGIAVAEYYGAAELSFVAADPDGTGLRPFPGAELAVREGVIWARSPYLCTGYLEAGPAAGPYRTDPAGWATVGDRGELLPDGTLAVLGRGEQGFSVGGQLVLAADVEGVLGGVPGVAELICLAEPHARLGERVVAVVRAQPGADPVPALREAARRGLPAAARPVRYVLMAELPRTAGGKVARAALRERVTTAGR